MKTLTESVKDVCGKNHIHLEPFPDQTGFKLAGGGKDSLVGHVYIDEILGTICVSTFLTLRVPQETKLTMAELVVRINHIAPIGHLSMDIDRGIVCYTTKIMIGKASVDDEIIEHVIFTNLFLVGQFFPVVIDVTVGQKTPRQAFEELCRHGEFCDEKEERTRLPEYFRKNIGDIIGGSLN